MVIFFILFDGHFCENMKKDFRNNDHSISKEKIKLTELTMQTNNETRELNSKEH